MKTVSAIPKTMRALVYRGQNDLRVETVPVPGCGRSELLVRVAVCGVCPTDIKKIEKGSVAPPRIFGHETAGTIVRVGAGVRGFAAGDRVALHHHVPCLKCHACRHRAFAQCPLYKQTGVTAGFVPAGGGFAEYVRVLAFVLPGVVKIPARNTFEEGAMLEPVNTVLKAVNRLSLFKGDRVLVAGQGPIGLMFTRLLTLRGVQVFATDLKEERLRLARRWGARWAARGDAGDLREQMERATHGLKLDAAVIAVPSDAVVGQALEWVRGGGKVLLFAHTQRGAGGAVDFAGICVDEKDLLGSYSSDFTLQKEVARIVFSGALAVRKLVTHRFGLERALEAISAAGKPLPGGLKVVVGDY